MKELRGIIVGAGHFAPIQMGAWNAVKGARIVGLVNRTVENGRKVADQFGIPEVGEDLAAMIDSHQPDFVDVCTNPATHFQYVRIAADHGVAVLCQKRVAPSREESHQLVDYCVQRRVPIMINDNWRWQSWYREIKKIMQRGLLGEVFLVHCAMRPGDGWGEDPYPIQHYFRDMPLFLVFETGVHYIDTFRFLFGDIRSVYCQTKTVNRAIKGEDFAAIILTFAKGPLVIYDGNRVTEAEPVRSETYGFLTVEGTAGKLRMGLDGRLHIKPRGQPEYEHRYEIGRGWKGNCAVATQQHFVDVLRDGGTFETEGVEYLKSQDRVDDCYRSAETNTVVLVGEARGQAG